MDPTTVPTVQPSPSPTSIEDVCLDFTSLTFDPQNTANRITLTHGRTRAVKSGNTWDRAYAMMDQGWDSGKHRWTMQFLDDEHRTNGIYDISYGVFQGVNHDQCNTYPEYHRNRCPGAFTANTDNHHYYYNLGTLAGRNTDIFYDEVVEFYLDLESNPAFLQLRKLSGPSISNNDGGYN